MPELAPSRESLRLDKWLWAARFFKTRQLAVDAVKGGKVQVNGQRAKPGRAIEVGARIEIHKGGFSWDVEVLALSKQRRSASEAVLLYAEDEGVVRDAKTWCVSAESSVSVRAMRPVGPPSAIAG
jgi:ribosome-associated heat shock protein Hsp15